LKQFPGRFELFFMLFMYFMAYNGQQAMKRLKIMIKCAGAQATF